MQIADCKLQIVERRGITLVELLVAISIMVVLMAVGSRMMRFSMEDRRTREAARQVDVYLSSARNRAMETGRPCGVTLRRKEGLPQSAAQLDQVEVPPPYAGETLEATAALRMDKVSPDKWATVQARMTPGINSLLVKDGDLVQFNHQGPLYEIQRQMEGMLLTLRVDVGQGQVLPWPTNGWSGPMPYQILRRPRKSATRSLQLPARTVVDLEAFGIDSNPILFKSFDRTLFPAITIMFSPNGTVDHVYLDTVAYRVAEPVFLLVGKQERVPAGSAEDGLANWQDPKNYWVTLNAQTGQVTTTENVPVDLTKLPAELIPPFDSNKVEHVQWAIRQARELARGGQSMGGR